ncbi:MAG: hypothetical protein NWF00_06560 [Candidatus Bathyarchaeota archaeon]|nr:hypothetical protein [Candidatus Bathyarchaeota archaeon]
MSSERKDIRISVKDNVKKELERRYVLGEISEIEYNEGLQRLRETQPEVVRTNFAYEAVLNDTLFKNLGNNNLYARGQISFEERTILDWKNWLEHEYDGGLAAHTIQLILDMQNTVRTTNTLRFYDVNVPNQLRYQKMTQEDIERLNQYHILDAPVVNLAKNAKEFSSSYSDSTSSNCFIATAAYGTPMAPEINILRQFRDLKMSPNLIGKYFIILYYFLSPPIARIISRNNDMRALVRFSLKPIVRLFRQNEV